FASALALEADTPKTNATATAIRRRAVSFSAITLLIDCHRAPAQAEPSRLDGCSRTYVQRCRVERDPRDKQRRRRPIATPRGNGRRHVQRARRQSGRAAQRSIAAIDGAARLAGGWKECFRGTEPVRDEEHWHSP